MLCVFFIFRVLVSFMLVGLSAVFFFQSGCLMFCVVLILPVWFLDVWFVVSGFFFVSRAVF